MKRTVAYLTMAMAVLLCAVSCLDNDAPISSGTLICNVINPARLQSDTGEFLNITESLAGSIPDSLKRLMISCDVLSQHENDENEFDIRLLGVAPVTITSPVLASENDEAELGYDALDITAWNSGGYLNTFTVFTALTGSKKEHALNLVVDDTRSGKDTLYLRFTHNAYGESFDNPDLSISDIIQSGVYFSYDLKDFIPDGAGDTVLHIEYIRFKNMDDIIFREKETISADLKFTR